MTEPETTSSAYLVPEWEAFLLPGCPFNPFKPGSPWAPLGPWVHLPGSPFAPGGPGCPGSPAIESPRVCSGAEAQGSSVAVPTSFCNVTFPNQTYI